jgi:UDP-N-acetylglucosamine 2-epimerase (non-hydrolysing)
METRNRHRQKILIVVGTRPEAIKMALLALAAEHTEHLETEVCVTAQHRSMLDQVLSLFGVVPRYDLNVMKDNQGLADITSRMVSGLTSVLREAKPDRVLVQGDTTTAFCAALAAFYEKIPVGHVEAGLRTGLRYSPWPEEMNRMLVGRLADLHMPPTRRAEEALLREGVPAETIHVTGNTVVDALLWVSNKLEHDTAARRAMDDRFAFLDPARKLILVTGHRRESFGRPFEDVCRAFVDIVRERPDVELIYPVHLNPHVREPVNAILAAAPRELQGRIHLIEPVEYLPFVYLMKRSHFIITDSGGVQEEAPSLGKPCLVTRNDTERPEAVEAGTAKLVGTDRERICKESLRLLSDDTHYRSMSRLHNPYGDGHATERVVALLRSA